MISNANGRIAVLLTGPIGVGKTTFALNLMKYEPFSTMSYINSDLYYALYTKGRFTTTAQDYAEAKEICCCKLERALSYGKSFVWETVAAKPDKLTTFQHFREMAYYTVTLFLGVSDASILHQRVRKRYLGGWYDVPIEKIESRCQMVMQNMPELIELSDEFVAFDTTNTVRPVMAIREGVKSVYDQTCTWIYV